MRSTNQLRKIPSPQPMRYPLIQTIARPIHSIRYPSRTQVYNPTVAWSGNWRLSKPKTSTSTPYQSYQVVCSLVQQPRTKELPVSGLNCKRPRMEVATRQIAVAKSWGSQHRTHARAPSPLISTWVRAWLHVSPTSRTTLVNKSTQFCSRLNRAKRVV